MFHTGLERNLNGSTVHKYLHKYKIHKSVVHLGPVLQSGLTTQPH